MPHKDRSKHKNHKNYNYNSNPIYTQQYSPNDIYKVKRGPGKMTQIAAAGPIFEDNDIVIGMLTLLAYAAILSIFLKYFLEVCIRRIIT